MQKTVVIDIVGLSESILGKYTPFLDAYIAGKKKAKIKPPFPAVTTTSQSVYLTGKYPRPMESWGMDGMMRSTRK